MANKPVPAPSVVRQLLDYNPATGRLYWRPRDVSRFSDCGRLSPESKMNAWNARNAGRQAFTASDGRGYQQGQVCGYHTTAHRVVWAIIHDVWPDVIDHINGNRSDNRSANLRSVTKQQNSRNMKTPVSNKSGHIGVRLRANTGRYEAMIRDRGRQVHLGTHACITAAILARKSAEKRLGYHENHGRS